jgi:hypothetical protein
MAFNSENDPDLLIDVDAWGKGFRSRRNDPSIHTSGPEVLSFFRTFDDSNSLANQRKRAEKDALDDDEEYEPSPWELKCRKNYKKYVQVSKMAARVARDAIFHGVDLGEVYRLIAERFQYEAKALTASVKAKRKKNKK